jgi:hypothetical protein
MITVKVKLEATGIVGVNNKYANDSFVTGINLSFEEAKKYYAVGKIFNMGLWYDSLGHEHEDSLMRVTSCELVSEN